jgi:hypothetical protein
LLAKTGGEKSLSLNDLAERIYLPEKKNVPDNK